MNRYDSVYNLPKDSYYSNHHPSKHHMVSWGAIVAGIVTSFMVAIVLTMLLMGLGLSSFDMQAENPGSTAGVSLGVGSLVIMLISLFSGSYISGKLSGRQGAMHGFLNWACLSLLAFMLSAMAISSAVKLSSSLVGSAFNLGAAGVSENQDSIKNAYNNMKQKGVAGNVKDALAGSSLNSDFLNQYKTDIQAKLNGKAYADPILNDYKADLNKASDAVAKAAQNFKDHPDNAQQITEQLKTDLEAISQNLASPITSSDIYNKLVADNIAADKAKTMADDANNQLNIARVETRNKIMDTRSTIANTQDGINNLPQNASDVAEDSVNKVGHGVWWAFLSSIIGAAISAFAGRLGAKGHIKHHKEHYDLYPTNNTTTYTDGPTTAATVESDVKIRNKEWRDRL